MTRRGLQIWALSVAVVGLLALPGSLGAATPPGADGPPAGGAYTRSR